MQTFLNVNTFLNLKATTATTTIPTTTNSTLPSIQPKGRQILMLVVVTYLCLLFSLF